MTKITQNTSRIKFELDQEEEFFAKGAHGEIHNATGSIEDKLTGEKIKAEFAVKYFTDPTKKDAEEEMVGHNFKNNVRVYAQGVKNGREYIVMEKTDGTLLSKMRKLDFIASLTPKRITEILLQIGHGIEEVRYQLGYEAHLDVAERNIHIQDGIVKLADYGVANTSDNNIQLPEDVELMVNPETDFFEVTETETIDATSFKPYHTTKPKDTIHPEVKTGSEGKQLHDIYSLLTLGQNLMKELNGFIRINTATDEQLSNREQLNRICGFASNLDPSTYVKEEHFKDMSKFLEYLSEQMDIDYVHGDLRFYWEDLDTYRKGTDFPFSKMQTSFEVGLSKAKNKHGKLNEELKEMFSGAVSNILLSEIERQEIIFNEIQSIDPDSYSAAYDVQYNIEKAQKKLEGLKDNLEKIEINSLETICETASTYQLSDNFKKIRNKLKENRIKIKSGTVEANIKYSYLQFKKTVENRRKSGEKSYEELRNDSTFRKMGTLISGLPKIADYYLKTINTVISQDLSEFSETLNKTNNINISSYRMNSEIQDGITQLGSMIEELEQYKMDEALLFCSEAIEQLPYGEKVKLSEKFDEIEKVSKQQTQKIEELQIQKSFLEYKLNTHKRKIRVKATEELDKEVFNIESSIFAHYNANTQNYQLLLKLYSELIQSEVGSFISKFGEEVTNLDEELNSEPWKLGDMTELNEIKDALELLKQDYEELPFIENVKQYLKTAIESLSYNFNESILNVEEFHQLRTLSNQLQSFEESRDQSMRVIDQKIRNVEVQIEDAESGITESKKELKERLVKLETEKTNLKAKNQEIERSRVTEFQGYQTDLRKNTEELKRIIGEKKLLEKQLGDERERNENLETRIANRDKSIQGLKNVQKLSTRDEQPVQNETNEKTKQKKSYFGLKTLAASILGAIGITAATVFGISGEEETPYIPCTITERLIGSDGDIEIKCLDTENINIDEETVRFVGTRIEKGHTTKGAIFADYTQDGEQRSGFLLANFNSDGELQYSVITTTPNGNEWIISERIDEIINENMQKQIQRLSIRPIKSETSVFEPVKRFADVDIGFHQLDGKRDIHIKGYRNYEEGWENLEFGFENIAGIEIKNRISTKLYMILEKDGQYTVRYANIRHGRGGPHNLEDGIYSMHQVFGQDRDCSREEERIRELEESRVSLSRTYDRGEKAGYQKGLNACKSRETVVFRERECPEQPSCPPQRTCPPSIIVSHHSDYRSCLNKLRQETERANALKQQLISTTKR